MKFLLIESLQKLSDFLSDLNLGDHLLRGAAHCFSLKMVKDDKRLLGQLNRAYSNEQIMKQHINPARCMDVTQIDTSIERVVDTPLGSLRDSRTVRLMEQLISTLNNVYEDFDFSGVSPHQFAKEEAQAAKAAVETRLQLVNKVRPGFFRMFWHTLNEAIDLKDCKVYSFSPHDEELEALRPYCLWSMDLFFLNEKQKRLLYLPVWAQSKIQIPRSRSNSDRRLSEQLDEKFDGVDDQMQWLPEEDMAPPRRDDADAEMFDASARRRPRRQPHGLPPLEFETLP